MHIGISIITRLILQSNQTSTFTTDLEPTFLLFSHTQINKLQKLKHQKKQHLLIVSIQMQNVLKKKKKNQNSLLLNKKVKQFKKNLKKLNLLMLRKKVLRNVMVIYADTNNKKKKNTKIVSKLLKLNLTKQLKVRLNYQSLMKTLMLGQASIQMQLLSSKLLQLKKQKNKHKVLKIVFVKSTK